jgi:hypothetical protein
MMSDWFKWLKEHCTIKLKAPMNVSNPFTPTTQEDPRTIETIKRTRASIKKQEVSMNMRALKSHSAECNDSWTCTNDPCFKIEPDKIVSEARASQDELTRYNKQRKKNKQRLTDMKKAQVKKS